MAEITPILITGAITVMGWYVTYAYTKVREDRTRRLDLLMKFRAKQIEEFYGPLLSLIEQIFNVWEVQEKIIGDKELQEEEQERIEEFFWQNYFTLLHKEIGSLLRSKLYLLEKGILPVSFTEYLKHATQEASQHLIWTELGIDTSNVFGQEFPEKFYDDVKNSLDRLMQKYQSGVDRLA